MGPCHSCWGISQPLLYSKAPFSISQSLASKLQTCFSLLVQLSELTTQGLGLQCSAFMMDCSLQNWRFWDHKTIEHTLKQHYLTPQTTRSESHLAPELGKKRTTKKLLPSSATKSLVLQHQGDTSSALPRARRARVFQTIRSKSLPPINITFWKLNH